MATIFRTRVVLGVNSGSANALLTHYWDSTGAAPAALVTEAMARVRASLVALTAYIGSTTTYIPNPVADEIDEGTGAIVGQTTGTAPAALSFTSGLNYLPLQTQGLIVLSTGLFVRGRRLKGRSFIPGLTVNASSPGGAPVAAFQTAMTAACTALGTTVLTAMNQRVWHRPQPGSPGLSSIVTSRAPGSAFGVLRSRRS